MSKYEDKIEHLLKVSHVEYQREINFPDLKDKELLRFDFGIYKSKKLIGIIEVDGEQHFQPVDLFGGKDEFKRVRKTDRLKNRYCLLHKIPLFRIPYTVLETFQLSDLQNFLVKNQCHNDNIINGRKN